MQLALRLRTEQFENDKHKIKDLKEKVKEADNKNTTLKSNFDQLEKEFKARSKLESQLVNIKDEFKILKQSK